VTQAIGFYGTDSLGYDAVGNLLSRARTSGGTTSSVTYGYNRGTNQLSSAAQKGSSTLGYSYDAAGNLISRAAGKTTQLALTYNADGRPAGAATESYKYDGFGERALINATATSHDIFGRSGELLAENTASGTLLRSYVYLNGLPLALVDGSGNIAYILADQVGQPQKMVDGSATLVWDRVADIFGATVAQPVGMTAALPLRFPGQDYDAATGLHYNHFRDYDPALGRYVQSDPIGLNGGVNTYAYAGGNPVRWSDASGLDVWIEGPSANEPPGHLSVNVGDPSGHYDSYSFGVNGDPWFGGEVYKDTEHGGEILPDYYLKTTAAEDAEVKRLLDAELGKKAPYRPWNTCRNFSQSQFNRIKNLGIGKSSAPPQRIPMPGAKSPIVPSSTSTSAWDLQNLLDVLSSRAAAAGSGPSSNSSSP